MGSSDNWGMIGGGLAGTPFLAEAGIIKGAREKVRGMYPDPPELPPEVEEVDVSAKKQYTKERLKSKKGRQSTILSSLGTQNKGGKTLLG